MLTDRIYCDLYDKVLQVDDKCAGCPFRLASKDQSTLGHIHAAIKAKKRKRSVEVWQSVAAILSGIVQVVK